MCYTDREVISELSSDGRALDCSGLSVNRVVTGSIPVVRKTIL